MMTSYDARDCFNRLGIWLTPLTVYLDHNITTTAYSPNVSSLQDAQGGIIPDAYRANVADPDDRLDYHFLSEVRFQASAYYDEVVPPPSAALLRLHAACAQITHLSGASDALEKLDDQDDDHWLRGMSRNPHEMSSNPVSFAALERALHRLQVGAL